MQFEASVGQAVGDSRHCGGGGAGNTHPAGNGAECTTLPGFAGPRSVSLLLSGDTSGRYLSMTHRGELRCKVCLGGPVYDDEYISPCQCKGQNEWVHTRCLEALRAKSDDPHRCELCGTLYRLPPPEPRPRNRTGRWWKPLLVALSAVALAGAAFYWAETAEQRRQQRQRRREARERRERMREQRQMLKLVNRQLLLVHMLMTKQLREKGTKRGTQQEWQSLEGLSPLVLLGLGSAADGSPGSAAPPEEQQQQEQLGGLQQEG